MLGVGIREQWRIFAFAVTGSALYGGMTIGSAFVMGQVSARAIVPALRDGRTTAGALLAAVLAIVGVAVLKIVGILGRRLGAGVMQYRLQASYRRRVTRQYLRLPLAWHQRHPTGTLLSNANADVEATWYPIAPLPFACGAVLMVVATGVALVLTDPVLALVGLVMFPSIFAVSVAYSRRMSPRMTYAQQLRAEVSGVAHESVDGALVVKTLGREEVETERFRARSLRLRDAMVAVGRVRGVFDPLMEALPAFGTLAVLLIGTARLRSGATTVADLVSVAYLFTVLALPVRAIGWVLGELPRAAVGWDRVQQVLQATGGQEYGETAIPVTDAPAELAVAGVSFRYGARADAGGGAVDGAAGWVSAPAADRTRAAGRPENGSDGAAPGRAVDPVDDRALRQVTFDVRPGRTVAVVGPTGSGKSTLMTLLVRLVDPDTGAVLLDGADLRTLRRGGVSRHAAVVSQGTFLFDDTVRENVTLGAGLGDEQVWAALRLAQADRFVRALPAGLDTRVGERGTSLSGGQRQRLALARAVVRRPRLLLLDDATSSVDPAVEAAILRGLRSADLAATVVVVAYRRATISLADEVVYVEHGRVLGRGSHDELLSTAECRTAPAAAAEPVGPARSAGAARTLARGLRLVPEIRRGLGLTLLLALVATAGRVVVPIAVQQTLDRGVLGRGSSGPDLGLVRAMVLACMLAVLVTTGSAYLLNYRLFRTAETALAALRVRAFRHIHDLSVLHQQAQRRGSLVSRVTSDVDQMSVFVQWGGFFILISVVQLMLATVLMAIYSWPLTLLVYACFLPLTVVLPKLQRRLAAAYAAVRERVGEMLSAIAESVVGAQTVRAYGIEDRTAARIDGAIERHYRAAVQAQTRTVVVFTAGELVAAVANAAVVVVGVLLGLAGHLTVGRLVAFLFLVTLFILPVQISTEALTEAQNALASFRRVLDVLDTEPDVADPGPAGRALPPGPLGVRFEHVHYAYPVQPGLADWAGPAEPAVDPGDRDAAPAAEPGREVLVDVDLEIPARSRVAVVGETGSGKTTFAKLLTRLMDPTRGRVLVGGVPLTEVSFDSLRSRVVMVPQDGFLFDASIADNVRYGRLDATDAEVEAAVEALGLGDWMSGLPAGVRTVVGERGEALSVGERQLVAIVRAYLADPDLLVLDEATSAVDPATEVRLQRALDSLTRGRTTLTIAHRLATAEAANEVIVVDDARIVQRGPHATLVGQPGVYARLHASWVAHRRSA